MSTTLEKYYKERYSLDVQDADRIFSSIMEELNLKDEDDRDMYENVMDAAKKYCSIRVDWNVLDLDEKVKQDSKRTSAHDSFISRINALARYLKQKGRDVSWREELGDLEKDPSYRKRIGDFACYMVLFAGLMAR